MVPSPFLFRPMIQRIFQQISEYFRFRFSLNSHVWIMLRFPGSLGGLGSSLIVATSYPAGGFLPPGTCPPCVDFGGDLTRRKRCATHTRGAWNIRPVNFV